jgi:hypothetical protein
MALAGSLRLPAKAMKLIVETKRGRDNQKLSRPQALRSPAPAIKKLATKEGAGPMTLRGGGRSGTLSGRVDGPSMISGHNPRAPAARAPDIGIVTFAAGDVLGERRTRRLFSAAC